MNRKSILYIPKWPFGKLVQHDWDFRDLEGKSWETVYFCFTHEYGREVDFIRRACLRDRKETPGRFDEHGTWHFEVMLDQYEHLSQQQWLEIIDAPLGFPEKPYLDCAHVIGDFAFYPLVSKMPMRSGAIVSAVWNGSEWLDEGESRLKNPHVHFLAIDWTAPISVRLAEFKKWMETHTPPYNVEEKQTGIDPAQSYRAKLKSLATLRLIRQCGKIADAIKYVKDRDCGGQFSNQANEWSREQAKASVIILEWMGKPVK